MANRPIQSMRDLLVQDLHMLYSAETQAVAGQALLVDVATDEELKRAFEQHGRETARQIERLERLMDLMSVAPEERGRETNMAIQGLIADTEKLLKQKSEPALLDAMLLAAAQKIEHYEIACYGTAVYMTKHLGLTEAADLLAETLEEEKRTDELLNRIAKQRVNPRAEELSSAQVNSGR